MAAFGVDDERFDFPGEERRVLDFWDDIDAFRRSVALAAGRPEYTFLDGPPFATGLPHYGHMLAGTVKDAVTRYAAMTGHRVGRVFGWDCHGLPVEHEIDKKHGIRCRADVDALGGIAAYNAECRGIVMRYAGEWEATVRRMARWIDMAADYKTMYPSFMESVWWVFAQLFAKNQVYRGMRVMPYSTACATPLSNFEIALNYRDVTELSVTVRLPLVGAPGALSSASLLVWTTTPWTLPANLGAAVHPELVYVVADVAPGAADAGAKAALAGRYVVAQALADSVFGKDAYAVVSTVCGADLVGLRFEPPFPFFADRHAAFPRTHTVIPGPFVTAEAGTGVVHMAPAFGEDDFAACLSAGIISETDAPCPVDDAGRLTVPGYDGVFWRDACAPIARELEAAGRLFARAQTTHSVPHCWRSDTQLIYRAVPCWFVRVAEIAHRLVEATDATHWVPAFVRDGRFRNWLGGARDWAVSRNRYWGTPIPVWALPDFSETLAVSSVAELEALAGLPAGSITDLHRESVDAILIPSRTRPGSFLKRIDEVFDCWFESGSVPFAQHHYPFENREFVDAHYPADFIAEGLDQTRGWFYTLTVLGVHLKGASPFKNVVVNGLVLAADGKKMSKRLKNYPEPSAVIEAHGADALRLYLLDSPAAGRAEPLRFSEDGVRAVVRDVLLPLWNAFRFYAQSVESLAVRLADATHAQLGEDEDAALHAADFVELSAPGAVCLGSPVLQMTPDDLTRYTENTTDAWILAALQAAVRKVREEMAAYRISGITAPLAGLVDVLTNWYIRLNRRRLRGDAGLVAQRTAIAVLEAVLQTVARAFAPFAPLFAEGLYQRLNPGVRLRQSDAADTDDRRSVHFLSFPEADARLEEPRIVAAFGAMRAVVERGRTLREAAGVPLKTPLAELVVLAPGAAAVGRLEAVASYVSEELNVRALRVLDAADVDEAAWGVEYRAAPNFRLLGARLKGDLGRVQAALRTLTAADLKSYLERLSADPGAPLTVAGHALSPEEVVVSRSVCASGALDRAGVRYAVAEAALPDSAGAAAVFLATQVDDSLRGEGLARDLAARVQRMRKAAGLRTTDAGVLVRLVSASDASQAFLSAQEESLRRMLRALTIGGDAGAQPIAAEDVDLGDGVTLSVRLERT